MRDIDVRARLHKQQLRKFHDDPNSYLIDEVEICGREARIDIAIINGSIHGYEIKSDKDTLKRLKHQSNLYSQVFDYVTLVVGESHLKKATDLIPRWWGIFRARESQNKVYIRKIRSPQQNLQIDSFAICQMLWRHEALHILERYNLLFGVKSKPKRVLWQVLAENLPQSLLAGEIRQALKSRSTWRFNS